MIAIVDYGVGNLFSLASSLSALGLTSEVTGDPQVLARAEKIILPGVGAFGDAMDKLTLTGLVPVLLEQAQRKPLLGICLGMQLLFETGTEFGVHKGLGLIPGKVCPLKDDLDDSSLKVPHMGWNSLVLKTQDPIFKYFENGRYVYYVHSFYAKYCAESTLAVSDYGGVDVVGVVRSGNVYGMQFHPEKSGDAGLCLLKAFAEL